MTREYKEITIYSEQENEQENHEENKSNESPIEKRYVLYSFLATFFCLCLIAIFFSNSLNSCKQLSGIENQCNGWDYAESNEKTKYLNCAIAYEACQTNKCSICAKLENDSVECIGENFGCITTLGHKDNILISSAMLILIFVAYKNAYKNCKQHYLS